LAFYYPLIGATAASHFGISGEPNAHQTKAAFFASWILAILMPGIVALGVPSMLGHIPVALINLPNKEYWFAPQRRAQTQHDFAQHFAWFGAASLALVVAVMNLVMRANLPPSQVIEPKGFWLLFALYLAFVVWWLARVFALFRLPG
jgi:uncharacterized membrane protein